MGSTLGWDNSVTVSIRGSSQSSKMLDNPGITSMCRMSFILKPPPWPPLLLPEVEVVGVVPPPPPGGVVLATDLAGAFACGMAFLSISDRCC